ncbi:hypothetical protein Tco_1396226 [Tanacetum coccineum]
MFTSKILILPEVKFVIVVNDGESSIFRSSDTLNVASPLRNLTPPASVVGSEGLVINEPESRIFYYNRNFDLVFQRQAKFHLATTPQLIRTQNLIRKNSAAAKDMYNKLNFVIDARSDVEEAMKIDSLCAKHQRALKDSLSAKHQRASNDSLSAKPQRATSDVFKSETLSRKSKIT